MRTLLVSLLALGFSLSCAGTRGPAQNRPTNEDLLSVLASPEFEGRGVGTKGLEKARDLLVAELENAGIAPAFSERGGKKSYTQSFRVFIGNELSGENSFAGSDKASFVPLAFSKSGAVRGARAVFAGFGITVRQGGKVGYDDYAGLDVKGKIVVVLTGDPGTGNKNSPFRNPAYYHYSSPMYKVQNAELHGAAGIVLVRDPLSLAGKEEPALRFQSRQGGGSTSNLLAGQISIRFAEQILKRNLQEVQERIAKTQKPASFALSGNYDMSVALNRQLGSVENVAGFLPGRNAARAKEILVIGAHYDHLGFGGDSSMDPEGTGKVHAGADDNASGVVMALNLAKRLKEEKPQRSVLVVFFSAEEVGLLGSKHFTESLPLPEGAKIAAMVNLDMVGRLDKNKLSVLAVRSAKEFDGIVEGVNRRFGFDLVKGDSGFGSSDHASFLQSKIPSLFFTTGAHVDYHRPSDTADKIEREGMRKIENFVGAVLQRLDRMPSPPTYDPKSEDTLEPPRGGRGYGVYFGSIPEFNQGEAQGVLLQGVRPNSPAAEAGLQAGDLLIALGEIQIKNLHDLVFALRFYRPNEEVDVAWLRDGKRGSGKAVLRNREERNH